MNRQAKLDLFYEILEDLEHKIGGKRVLGDCDGRMPWPKRGLYFFFEEGELREDCETPRVVRVGTHALKLGSRTTLWDRLITHRGTKKGNGNHRGSIFRKHVGNAILNKTGRTEEYKEWPKGSSAPRHVREKERPIEMEVSQYLGNMPFLWLKVDDPPGPDSMRSKLEIASIALLSNYQRDISIDGASEEWLGHWCPSAQVRGSGLWNVKHVSDRVDPDFLRYLENAVREMR